MSIFRFLNKENNFSLFTRLLFRNQDIHSTHRSCILTFSWWWTKRHLKKLLSVLDTHRLSPLPLFPKQCSIIKYLYKIDIELGNVSGENLKQTGGCVCVGRVPLLCHFVWGNWAPADFGIFTEPQNQSPQRNWMHQEWREGREDLCLCQEGNTRDI